MPKRRRHQPGKYKPKQPIEPNFVGPKPLTLFQSGNVLWGAKDGNGDIEIEPIYRRLEQTEEQKISNEVLLISQDIVLFVTPYERDVVSWFSSEFFERDD